MLDSYNKIARILRVSPEFLFDLDQTMAVISGQEGVIDDIAQQNEILVSRTLTELGLTKESSAEEVYSALVGQLTHFDQYLYQALDNPDLEKMSIVCGKLCELAFKVFTPPKGLFIKKEKIVELLEQYKPDNLLNHLGYATTRDLVEKEGFAPVVSALRFAQGKEWMHKFFDQAYSSLTIQDFEERDIELVVLDVKWLAVVEKFIEKKYHNVSHLKEYGVIFIIPLKIDTPGETLRMFTLILHYLHEVPFYTGLFKKFMSDNDFAEKLKSLLRGDVLESEKLKSKNEKLVWLVTQRYLAKDDENDPRLFVPHINPEAEHWFQAENDLGRLSRILGDDEQRFNLGYWTGLDFVGDLFKDKNGEDKLVSFALIDLIMSLVEKDQIKYLYHQQEAMWNKIFSEYMGRETMNRMIEENIVRGFVELQPPPHLKIKSEKWKI